MSFFIIIFVLFFLIPWATKANKKSSKKIKRAAQITQKTWGQTHTQIQDKYGHSGARNTAHKRLHNRDASSAFPKGHQEHVRKRDLRDVRENSKMEQTIHSRKNVGIIRAGNKGRSDWGARGDKGSLRFWIGLIFVVALAYFMLTKV